MASCFCSQCQISRCEEWHINRTYAALVPALMDGEVKETVIMDTRVLPVGVDEPLRIKFRARAKECRVSRVTGTSGRRAIRLLLKNFGRTLNGRKSPHLLPT